MPNKTERELAVAATPPTAFDAERAERFAERVTGILNAGALSLLFSIGHRTGLFDTLARSQWITASELASAAGLHERYVREWLGGLATAGVVEHEAATRRFRLPPEHAASLARSSRPNQLAARAQWLSQLGRVEDELIRCFEHGGGVPYASFERLHELMAEESDRTVVAYLVERIIPLVDGLAAALERGIDVLDVGCGSGRALQRLASCYPRSRFTGLDLSVSAIAAARERARRDGLHNLSFAVRDVTELDVRSHFDLVTAFDAIHEQAWPEAALAAIARALRATGVFLMQDVFGTSRVEDDARHPLAPFLYTLSCMHCTTVSLAQGGAGLGAMWGSEVASRMLEDAGFAKVAIRLLPHDPVHQYYVARLSD